MTLPKELREKAQAAATDDGGHANCFMAGVEWLYGELEPKIEELERKLKEVDEALIAIARLVKGES